MRPQSSAYSATGLGKSRPFSPALVVEGWEKARCATVEYSRGVTAKLYWPAEAPAGPLPVVLFAIGFPRSAFVGNMGKPNSDMVPNIVWSAEMADRGFLVVCPDPVSGSRDMAAIMKWVATRSSELGVDPGRIAFFSVSANPKVIPSLMNLPEAATCSTGKRRAAEQPR